MGPGACRQKGACRCAASAAPGPQWLHTSHITATATSGRPILPLTRKHGRPHHTVVEHGSGIVDGAGGPGQRSAPAHQQPLRQDSGEGGAAVQGSGLGTRLLLAASPQNIKPASPLSCPTELADGARVAAAWHLCAPRHHSPGWKVPPPAWHPGGAAQRARRGTAPPQQRTAAGARAHTAGRPPAAPEQRPGAPPAKPPACTLSRSTRPRCREAGTGAAACMAVLRSSSVAAAQLTAAPPPPARRRRRQRPGHASPGSLPSASCTGSRGAGRA